jgi:hypothetical protein
MPASGQFPKNRAGGTGITPVPISITAFVGRAQNGPVDEPVPVHGFAEFKRIFGGLWAKSQLGYSVDDFFLNGGRDALVVRVADRRAAGDKPLNALQFLGDSATKTGLYALDRADLFNLLVVPPCKGLGDDLYTLLLPHAVEYCAQRRAILLIDPKPAWDGKAAVERDYPLPGVTPHANAALYFPHILKADPLQRGQVRSFAPGGAIAGIIARTDHHRGVWKAPAGTQASLRGVTGLSVTLSDAENGELGSLGINCLRTMPTLGPVVWGARTTEGDDGLASQWKYLPVRRTALFIEESLYRGTEWAVFEPNDEPLWAQLRQSVGDFMHSLFQQGAFQGPSAADAYFVKCDDTTTTGADVIQGFVNILVGFAPLKPAEFVILQIRQRAGQPVP